MNEYFKGVPRKEAVNTNNVFLISKHMPKNNNGYELAMSGHEYLLSLQSILGSSLRLDFGLRPSGTIGPHNSR